MTSSAKSTFQRVSMVIFMIRVISLMLGFFGPFFGGYKLLAIAWLVSSRSKHGGAMSTWECGHHSMLETFHSYVWRSSSSFRAYDLVSLRSALEITTIANVTWHHFNDLIELMAETDGFNYVISLKGRKVEERRILDHPPWVVWGLYGLIARVEPCPLIGSDARVLSLPLAYPEEEFDIFRHLFIGRVTIVCQVSGGRVVGA
ncbi:hypothetical protein U1Q18_009966 [Sarracenia purpurea var. burkii]